MKKLLSVSMAVVMLILTLVCGVSATEIAKISGNFKSDIAGLTAADYEKLVDISDSNLEIIEDKMMVCNYVNDVYLDGMKAGRNYYIYFEFDVADGYAFPDELNDEDVSFNCEKGGEIIWFYYVNSGTGTPDHLYICEKVTVNGNIFQKLFGKVADAFLKIFAWSPY